MRRLVRRGVRGDFIVETERRGRRVGQSRAHARLARGDGAREHQKFAPGALGGEMENGFERIKVERLTIRRGDGVEDDARARVIEPVRLEQLAVFANLHPPGARQRGLRR
jgi:hypothetical protein